MLKHCNGCNRDLPHAAFYFNKQLGCLRSKCKECINAQTAIWQKTSPRMVTIRRNRYQQNLVVSQARSRANAIRYNQSLRKTVLEKLGNVCKCGFSDPRALQIDHVHDDGSTERRRLTRTQRCRLILADTSGRYQILCANCNWRKRIAALPRVRTAVGTHNYNYEQRLRATGILLLGGKCSCGEVDPIVLQFDHIRGGGNRERKQLKLNSARVFRDVLKYGCDKYQLLCANCNRIKGAG
jgi:hypothetical protein